MGQRVAPKSAAPDQPTLLVQPPTSLITPAGEQVIMSDREYILRIVDDTGVTRAKAKIPKGVNVADKRILENFCNWLKVVVTEIQGPSKKDSGIIL